MFDQIFFTQVQFPTPVTPAEVERQMSRNAQNLQEKENGTQEELPANMRNADYFIFGKMDTFSRPPVTDFALENLFYMEAFSIFTCPKGFFTNRKDYQSFLIIYTYEGNGALEYMGKSYSLGPGDGFFIDCRVPHLYRTVGGCLEAWRIPLERASGTRPVFPVYGKWIRLFLSAFYRQLSKEAGGTVIHLWLRTALPGLAGFRLYQQYPYRSSQERVRGKRNRLPRYRKICGI